MATKGDWKAQCFDVLSDRVRVTNKGRHEEHY